MTAEALFAAARDADVAEVERLLAEGASPLTLEASGASLLRAAHHDAPTSESRATLGAVRRAAKAELMARGDALPGLAAEPGDARRSPDEDRGVADARAAVGPDGPLDILLVERDVKTTAKALAALVQAPRREADVADRPVPDGRRMLFPYRLAGMAWTIVPCVFAPESPWHVGAVPELPKAGSGVAPLARALAKETQARVIHLRHDRYTAYAPHGGAQTHDDEPDPHWSPSDDPPPSADEAEALLPDWAGPAEGRIEAAAVERERRRRRAAHDAALAELGVLVPACHIRTDGVHAQLVLHRVAPADVERVDVVVLQELGDPLVDRRPAVPSAAPSAASVASSPAAGPPRVAPAPKPSEAPPLVSEPPPVVTNELPPRPGPPKVTEPPPMVTEATPNAPPPPADPPPTAPSDAAPEPPPPAPSKAPPMANAPPPMVTEPVVTRDDELAPPPSIDGEPEGS